MKKQIFELRDKVESGELTLEEFAEYGSNLKAKIVYMKCLQNQKFEIAKRIKEKYKLVDKHDDTVMSLGFALMTQSNCR